MVYRTPVYSKDPQKLTPELHPHHNNKENNKHKRTIYIHTAAAVIRLYTRCLLYCLLVIHPPVHPTRSRISSALSPGPRLALRSTGSAHVMRPHAPSLGVCCSLLCPWPFMPPVVPYPVFAPPLAELLFDNLLRVVTTEVPTLLPPGSWSYLIRLSR